MPAATLSATDFAALQTENDALRGQVSGFSSEVKSLSALVEKLTFQLAMLRRMQFGQKSEASARMDDLFGTPIALDLPGTPPKAPPRKTRREPKAAPRVTLPPNLPVDVVVIDLPATDKRNRDGTPLRQIGEETSDRLAVTPGRWFIKRTVRPKYADPAVPESGVRCAPLPARIIDGGLLDESVLADRASAASEGVASTASAVA